MKSTLLLFLLLSAFTFSPMANASKDNDLKTYQDIYSEVSSMKGLYQGTNSEGKACSLEIKNILYYEGETYAFIINYGTEDWSTFRFTENSLANSKIRKISKAGKDFYIYARFNSYNQYTANKYGIAKFVTDNAGKWEASIESGRVGFFGNKESVLKNCSGQMK